MNASTNAMATATATSAAAPIRTEWVNIAPGFAGYLAVPPAGSGPALVLWPEIFGINPHIRGVVEQYALDGFVVLAPDVFWRQAPRVELAYDGDDRPRAMQLMQGYGDADKQADIAAAVAALRARPETAGRKLGTIGYCLGGKMAYLTAASAQVDAAVAYYGGGIQQQLDLAAHIGARVQFHFASEDAHIPPAAVQAVRDAVVGKTAEVHLYPGADHGFNCWARGSYHPASAALAHGRSLAFLATHLFD